jgi:ribosome biogenesis GTPase A
MTKTRRMMEAHIGLVDLVIELLDARLPLSSKNPDIDTLAAKKPRLIILTKADMANVKSTARWEAFFRQSGFFTLAMDLKTNKQKAGLTQLLNLVQEIMAEKLERQRKKGRLAVPIRVMVVGIPNVGKSTFINLIAGKAVTAVADKPGVTRGRQWITVRTPPPRGGKAPTAFGGFDLMDTPGVLWPKFEDPEVGLRLAVTGAVSDTILDKITLAEHLVVMLSDVAPMALTSRYRLPAGGEEDVDRYKNPRRILSDIGEARGFKIKGGAIDLERTAIMLLDEFRGGKLGRITLEEP